MRTSARRALCSAVTVLALAGSGMATAAHADAPAAAGGATKCSKNVKNYASLPTTTVNLRSRASSSSTSLGILYKSTDILVHCTAAGGSWSKITVYSGANKGRVGWLATKYIEVRTCIPEDPSCGG